MTPQPTLHRTRNHQVPTGSSTKPSTPAAKGAGQQVRLHAAGVGAAAPLRLPPTGALTVLLERNSREASFACGEGFNASVVGAELGRGNSTFDVTPAVATACGRVRGLAGLG